MYEWLNKCLIFVDLFDWMHNQNISRYSSFFKVLSVCMKNKNAQTSELIWNFYHYIIFVSHRVKLLFQIKSFTCGQKKEKISKNHIKCMKSDIFFFYRNPALSIFYSNKQNYNDFVIFTSAINRWFNQCLISIL